MPEKHYVCSDKSLNNNYLTKTLHMNTKRRTAQDALHHVYKITRDKGVLFYRAEDHLVYYTLQSVLARRHRLRILGTSHMFTHVHEGTLPEDLVQLSSYEHDLSLIFAREYNRETGRAGSLFERPFGSAPKRSDKERRSCMIYIFNNPVEKKLVQRAEEDRWNFLAYYEKDYPFSRRPVIRYSRKPLVEAIHLVEHEFQSGRYLRYNLLHRLFSGLNEYEREQLIDFVIQRYFFFDRRACEELFGGIPQMIKATALTTGKEFDVGEEYDPYSDVPYGEMCTLVEKHGLMRMGLPFLHLSEERQTRLASYLAQHSGATAWQVARFLHQEMK